MTLDDYIHIEEILTEASAFGLRTEVQEWANKLLTDGYAHDVAYSMAFDKWCK